MSLLVKEQGNMKISYQLPLKFDEQLGVVSKVQTLVNEDRASFNIAKVWQFIKDDVEIEIDGKDVWLKGTEIEEHSKGKMLGYSFTACQLFIEQFLVFIQEQGIAL